MLTTALILAGGLGTRLRPLTDTIPKPLLPIQGKPILEHVVTQLRKHGVKSIILSIGYKHEEIQAYFGNGKKWGVTITYSIEDQPLGTGGAIRKAVGKTPLFVVWGDNLMDVEYSRLYAIYEQHNAPVTMTLTAREDVEHFGVAKMQGNNIISFVEKPARNQAPSNLINAGAIILQPECLSMLPLGKCSIEYDLYQKLKPGEIIAYIHEGQWFPTDTLEKYRFANENFRTLEF